MKQFLRQRNDFLADAGCPDNIESPRQNRYQNRVVNRDLDEQIRVQEQLDDKPGPSSRLNAQELRNVKDCLNKR